MKRLLHLAAAIALGAAAQTGLEAQTTHKPQYREAGRPAFAPGEDLTYTVRYGFIRGGEGRFTVRDTTIGGRRANHIVCGGRTTGVADLVFRVRDSYESYMDPETHLPIISKRNISEGRYKYRDEVLYDRTSGTMEKSVASRGAAPVCSTDTMPAGLVDMVGAFYHARSNIFDERLVPGDTIFYETFFSDEIFPLHIRYDGPETIKTIFGRKRCMKFTPVTEVGRAFKSKDDMHLWVTADSNRLPVKISFDMPVGSFVCELTKASGLLH